MSKQLNFTSNSTTGESSEIGGMNFKPITATAKQRKNYFTKVLVDTLPYFMPHDAFDPAPNEYIRDLFFRYFQISFSRGNWVTYGLGAAERIEPIKYFYRANCYPSIETMVKYANMELKRLKEEKNPSVSKSGVFTPANATAAEDNVSISSLVESAKSLEKEILALTKEINDGLNTNSAL
jgi:hypothetical protein